MKTILQIAEEEGFYVDADGFVSGHKDDISFDLKDKLERFAARIRAEQKKKDVKICLSLEYEFKAGHECADAIRNSKD